MHLRPICYNGRTLNSAGDVMDTQLKGKAVVLPPEPSASGGAGLGDVAISGTCASGYAITGDSASTASWKVLNKSSVGLSNVDNTSDANKPVSTAQQTALNAKAPLANPTFTGNVSVPNINGASPSGLANKIENGCMRIPSSAGVSGPIGLGQTSLYGAEGIRTFIGDWSEFSGDVYQVGTIQDARTSSGAMHYVRFVTTTGASGYILYTYRIKAQEALTLAGKPLTLSCRLTAGTTSASNHSFRIYKANAYDNFSGETFVATSGNLGAVSGTLDTGAQFTLSGADCCNGIIVQVFTNYTGAPVFPAYLSIADFSCRSGSRVVPFEARPLELEKALLNRFKPTAPINLTANTTLASNSKYSYSAGALTLTLPAAPVNGDEVIIYNTGSLLTTVVGRNGKTIMGLAQDVTLDIANKKFLFEYLSASGDWRLS